MDIPEFAGKVFGLRKPQGIGDFIDRLILPKAAAALAIPGFREPLFGGHAEYPAEFTGEAPGTASQSLRQLLHPIYRSVRVLPQTAEIAPSRTPDPRPARAGSMRNDPRMTTIAHNLFVNSKATLEQRDKIRRFPDRQPNRTAMREIAFSGTFR